MFRSPQTITYRSPDNTDLLNSPPVDGAEEALTEARDSATGKTGPGQRGPGETGPGETGRDFTSGVVEVLKALDPGEVMTYGEVANEAGYPGAARAVGNLLRTTPDLPWWRVVTANGRLVPGHEQRHAELLRAEGVLVRNGRVIT